MRWSLVLIWALVWGILGAIIYALIGYREPVTIAIVMGIALLNLLAVLSQEHHRPAVMR